MITLRSPVPLSSVVNLPKLSALLLPDLHCPFGQTQKQALLGDRSFLDGHDWVVLMGDVTACYGTPGEYGAVSEFLAALNAPYSVINGNHEFYYEPMVDGQPRFGTQFVKGSAETQQLALARFKQFYGLSNLSEMARGSLGTFCLLGVDSITDSDSSVLSDKQSEWLAEVIKGAEDQPLFIFSHYPCRDERLHFPGDERRRYFVPSREIEAMLSARRRAAFWFSGHVHLGPEHPLSTPYQTREGVWQIHCPDGWGFGRLKAEHIHAIHHPGLFTRSIHLTKETLVVRTHDRISRTLLSTDSFELS